MPYRRQALLPWGGEEGGELVVWAEYIEPIGKMIREYKLPEIEPEFLPYRGDRMMFEKVKDIYGGKRGPHLHYGGKVYAVNPEQWKVFKNTVVQDCQERLARAHEVSLNLDAVAQIGELAAGLTY